MAPPTNHTNINGINTATPKKPKPRSIAPPNEDPFGSQNKGPLKKTKSKTSPKKPAAPKKTPMKAAAARKPPPTCRTPKKAATGKARTKPAATTAAKAQASMSSSKGGQVDAGNGVRKAAPTERGRPAKRASVMDIMRSQVQNSSKASVMDILQSQGQISRKESVLSRATANADHDFEILHNGMKRAEVRKREQKNSRAEEAKVFRVMDLPCELRAKIWREAVVRPRAFIRPEDKLTREQPDLAMTCRQVREEVLPIFYAENVFAVTIARPNAYRLFQKWARALEGMSKEPGWFSCIRKWAICYEERSTYKLFHMTPPAYLPERPNFLLAVSFTKRQHDGSFWDASVEVHRDARCILPGHEQHGLCSVGVSPAWLNELVIAVTEAAKGRSVNVQMMLDLISEVEKKVLQLGQLRCEEVFASVEV